MDAQKFGTFLAGTRKERGLTQAELAEKLHVTDKAVSRWERGLGFPDIRTLEPLAQALGLTVAELMHGGSPEKDSAPENAADAAVANTLELVRRQQAEEDRQELWMGGAALVMILALVYALGISSLVGVIVLCGGVLTAIIAHRQLRSSDDPFTQKLCGVLLIFAPAAAAISAIAILPDPMLDRYGPVIQLGLQVYLFWVLLRDGVKLLRNKNKKLFDKVMLAAVPLALLLLYPGLFKKVGGDVVLAPMKERAAVAEQFAMEHLLREQGLPSQAILDRETAYESVHGDYPDSYQVTLTWRDPETGRTEETTYSVSVDRRFHIQIAE